MIQQTLRRIMCGKHQFQAAVQLGVLTTVLLEPAGLFRGRDSQGSQKQLFQR